MLKKITLVLPVKTSSIALPDSYSLEKENDYELQPLKNNIAENGILSPIIIRETEKGRYEAVCGKRRLMCARLLGMKAVPCIKVSADALDAKIMSVSETLSIRQPDYFSLANALFDLVSSGKEDEMRYRLGISESFLSSKLSLLKLSEPVKRRISAAGLSEKQALLLLKLSPERHNGALDYIIANALDDRSAAEYIDNLLHPKVEPPKPVRKVSIGDLKLFSNSLAKLVSTLSFAGYESSVSKTENEKYIDYSIRIAKKCESSEYYQIPLC